MIMKVDFKIVTALVLSLFLVSCKMAVREAGGEALERTVKELAHTGGKKTLKEISTSNKLLKSLFSGLESTVSKDFAESITVSGIGTDVLELVSREFPASRMILNIKNRTIECSAGSLKNSGPMNEFLNTLLPNMTYKVDGCFTYVTDKYGRVVKALGDRSRAYKVIERNTQRNSDIQKRVVIGLDGRAGVHDAGHLFSNTSGGPNELINQVPMLKNVNRNGRWRELERLEEEAVKAGKQVVSERQLLYKGSSKCPYAIKFTYIIDGEKVSKVVKNIEA